MTFSVWAPLAQAVQLELAGATHPMQRDVDGWWRAEQPAVSGETRYRFVVDDAAPTPDPRSLWQPDGVHGPSCVWDLVPLRERAAPLFRARPLSEAVLYELHVGTFTADGTYAAAKERLPHLRDLGVTHVELMPLATFPGERGWGYDGVYLYAPHPAYGTPADLADFIDAAHAHGLAVLLDVVYNHLGPDGNILAHYGPYFTDHWKTPWGSAVNFDAPYSDEVRAFVIENALLWLRDYRFDGLRLDAVQMLFDARAKHVLEELGERVAELARESGRDLVLIGESDKNDPRYIRPPALGGFGLHGHWADELHHTLHAWFTGERDGYYGDFGALADIAKALRTGYVFDGQYSAFRRRGHGRPPEGVRPEQFIVCAQNHDQIGNRALGDRLCIQLPPEKVKALAALVLLSPFTPLLFQGEEWGAQTPFQYFTDHHDAELAKAVTEGRRHEFAAFRFHEEDVPDPQARSTFVHSKLRWAELDDPLRQDLLAWHRALIQLRRERKAMWARDREVSFGERERWLTLRVGRQLVTLNLDERPQRVPLPPGVWEPVLCSTPVDRPAEELPGWATVVWREPRRQPAL